MEKTKKIKIILGTFYLIAVSVFLFIFFSNFSLQEITSYEFIKNNRDYFFELRKSNFLILVTLFVLFTIVWVFMGGFGFPIALFSGFIFGKWLGVLFLVFGMAIGATLFYVFVNYFLKEMVKEKFLKRFQNLEAKFKKSEFIYLLIYRLIGGIPFAIANVLPCLFNVKINNFFWTTLLGLVPPTFLIASIGNGLEKIIDQNLQAPSIMDIIISPDIYLPLIGFFILIIISIIVRKFFYKN
tara:strand:- start:187 stop:906 length:720 start_codon:yes stop_codon:yes gene_type:complete